MERSADRKQLGALGSAFVGEFRGTLDGGGVSGNHNLFGRVEVGGFTDFAVGGVFADLRDFFRLHAQDRRHRPYSHRHGFLHVLAAVADGADGIGKVQRPGGNLRGIFAQGCVRRRNWA